MEILILASSKHTNVDTLTLHLKYTRKKDVESGKLHFECKA